MQLSSVIPVLSAIFLLITPHSARSVQMNLINVNVLADPSISLPISEIARRFSSQSNIAITTAFAAANSQSDNIIAGLEADVFITAQKQMLETLKVQGLVDVYSQQPVTRNRLSIVTYGENQLEMILMPKLPIHSIFERIDPEFTFSIGDPDYQTSGFFALKALRNYEMAGDLEPNMLFVRSPVDMHQIISRKGGYGIVYKTAAARDPSLKILGTFPEVAHAPIIYYGVAVAGANMDASRRFLSFLASKEAQAIFAKHGFEPVKGYLEESGHLARGSTVNGLNSPL